MSTPARPDQDTLERYVESMAYASLRVIATVHDEGPDTTRQVIDEVLSNEAPPGVNPVHALIVALAAQVDPDTTTSQRFDWLLSDRVTSRPTPQRNDITSITGRTVDDPTPERDLLAEATAVEQLIRDVVRGDAPLTELHPSHRLEAVRRCVVDEGLNPMGVASRVRCGSTTAYRYVELLDADHDADPRVHQDREPAGAVDLDLVGVA